MKYWYKQEADGFYVCTSDDTVYVGESVYGLVRQWDSHVMYGALELVAVGDLDYIKEKKKETEKKVSSHALRIGKFNSLEDINKVMEDYNNIKDIVLGEVK